MIALVRKFFWLAFFCASTVAFVVLFEHGTADFQKNYKLEVDGFVKFFQASFHPKKDDSDAAAQ